jgi:hypothetical protein
VVDLVGIVKRLRCGRLNVRAIRSSCCAGRSERGAVHMLVMTRNDECGALREWTGEERGIRSGYSLTSVVAIAGHGGAFVCAHAVGAL